MQPRHRVLAPAAGEYGFAGVAPKAMQPPVSFGADDPHDRIRMAVACRNNGRPGAAKASTPGGGHGRRRGACDLQNRQSALAGRLRTARARTLKRNEGLAARRISCRGRADRGR